MTIYKKMAFNEREKAMKISVPLHLFAEEDERVFCNIEKIDQGEANWNYVLRIYTREERHIAVFFNSLNQLAGFVETVNSEFEKL